MRAGEASPVRGPARERIEARAADGVDLAITRVPARGPARATCLCAHAMMARSSYFASSGFADHLAGRGIDVFLLDFRGHGQSGSPASWTFDDLVRFDVPAAVDAAASAAGVSPSSIAYLGHSLGGLAGTAAFATGAAPQPGRIALVSTSVWLEGRGGSRLRKLIMSALAASGRPTGRVPIRRLRVGSDDESYPYMAQLAAWVRTGRWTSLDGRDYLAAAAGLHVPVLAATGEGDWMCRPRDAEQFRAALPGAGPLRRVGRRFGDPFDPDHFTMFTRARLSGFWDELAEWLAGGESG